MGWCLRRSIQLGPLRLNLSKRGLGASMGVRGLRAGVDAGGKPYVAGGRGGIYFRERLRTTDSAPARSAPPRGSFEAAAWTLAIVLAVIVLLLLGTR
jgi:hypothetical protein